MSTTNIEVIVPDKAVSRDAIRSAILGTTHKPKTRVIEFFGVEIELRQPTLGAVLDAREDRGEGQQTVLCDLVIQRAYVPGTDERVFEEADRAVMLQLPFGEDFLRVNAALGELSDVNFLDKKDTSESTRTA